MKLFEKMFQGCIILNKYQSELCYAELVPIPNRGGLSTAPLDPVQAYFSVAVDFAIPMSEGDRIALLDLGWRSECEGDFWVLYG